MFWMLRHGQATAVTSTDPTIMLTGPVPVTERALRAAGMTIGDIDLFEVNEAFACQVLAQRGYTRAMNGGAMATLLLNFERA